MPAALRVTVKVATPLAFALLVNALAPAIWMALLLIDAGLLVTVSVTGVLGPTPVTVPVNGAPAAGVASDTVKVNPGGAYAMAADGAKMRAAAAAAATRSARRIMARSPDKQIWQKMLYEQINSQPTVTMGTELWIESKRRFDEADDDVGGRFTGLLALLPAVRG